MAALLDHPAPEGQPAVADPVVVAALVAAEAVRRGLSQPTPARQLQAPMVVAQTKRTRKSARPIALNLKAEFRAQPNPANSNRLSPYASLRAAAWSCEAEPFLACPNVGRVIP